jgi:uncharacterized membrane protein
MMASQTTPPSDTIAATAVLATTLLFSIPHAASLVSHTLRGRESGDAGNYSPARRSAWYHDADGKSTPASVAEYDARLRKVKAANVALAVVGVVTSALAALTPGICDGQWTTNGILTAAAAPTCWAVVLAQVCVVGARFTHTALRLGAYSSASCAGLLALLLMRLTRGLFDAPAPAAPRLAMEALQALASGLLLVGCTSIPRRPAIYDADGVLVDPEGSASLVSKTWYSFFGQSTMAAAQRGQGHLEIEDLTRPARAVRSATLASDWARARGGDDSVHLWRRIFAAHRRKFFRQWATAVVLATSRMAPSWVLHRLLTDLARVEGSGGWRERAAAMSWAVVLIAIMVFETVGQQSCAFEDAFFTNPPTSGSGTLPFPSPSAASPCRCAASSGPPSFPKRCAPRTSSLPRRTRRRPRPRRHPPPTTSPWATPAPT